ncbi:hypothetical protein [uncultured Bacteroides sp.]|nr:hypothetical protein [uncultured Bacteroides sp.]
MDLYIIFAAITYLERVTGMGSLNKIKRKRLKEPFGNGTSISAFM